MRRHELRIVLQKLFNNTKIWFILKFYKQKLHQGRIRSIFSGFKPKFDKVGYLLPTVIAAACMLILFLTAPAPVSSKIASKESNSHQGVIVHFDDTKLGWIASKQAFFTLKESIPLEDRWFFTHPTIREGLRFEEAATRKPDREMEQTIHAILTFTENHSPGYAITIDDKPLLALQTEELCKEVIEEIVASFSPKHTTEEEKITDVKVSVEENPQIRERVFTKKELLTKDEALRYLQKGTLEEKIYTVVKNDTIWSIAKKHGLSMDEIIRANPDIRPDYIYPNDTLSLIVPKPFLTVRTEYTHEYTRRIQFKTIVKADSSLYRTEYITERPGQFGKERIMARICMTNGLLHERETLQQEILKSPVSAIVRMGTARTPDDVLIASAFLPPGVGVITSHFGPRWGRFHHGIDVSAPLGTPVYAYDAGTVVYTGYDHVLGNLVAISHGNDFVTRYGHMQIILVKVGETVEKGTTISLSGNSGYSTGPHVHFEIREKGVAMDPLAYLKNLQAAADSSRPFVTNSIEAGPRAQDIP